MTNAPVHRLDNATTLAEATDFLHTVVAELLGVPAAAVARDRVLRDQGLDSARTVTLLSRLADRLGRPVPAGTVWQHPTIDAPASSGS